MRNKWCESLEGVTDRSDEGSRRETVSWESMNGILYGFYQEIRKERDVNLRSLYFFSVFTLHRFNLYFSVFYSVVRLESRQYSGSFSSLRHHSS